MESDARPRILLFGAGGVGTIYLWLLSKVATTTAVCRSNYDVVKRDGFIINSSTFGQNIHFRPNVVRNCEEAASTSSLPFDFVIVCSKAIPDTNSKLIIPAVKTGHTTIVLIQNGVGIEEEYSTAFPNNPIISTVVYLPVAQRPIGVINHGEIEKIELGSYPSTASNHHSLEFTKLIQSAGGTAEFHQDIQPRRWTKLLVNASWNPICALTLCKDAEVLEASQEAHSVALGVMLEIQAIAAAHGYLITKEELDFQLGRAQARIPLKAGIKPSMLQDVETSKRLEIEAILGNPVRMGKKKGVQCVRLEMLYVLGKALDAHIGSR